MIQLSFGEFQKLAKQGNLIPVYDVFSADLLTPVSAYLRWRKGRDIRFCWKAWKAEKKSPATPLPVRIPEEVFRYAGGACVLESRTG